MVGFAGALIGGALKGWGTGTVEEIKQKREEKLKELDRQFQSQESALTRDVQREQIAATERQTAASLGVQKELGLSSQATQKSIAALQEGGQNARSAATIAAEERMNNARLVSAKDLAEFQDASAQKLNSRLVPIVKDGKTTYEYLTPDGTKIPKLKGPDGKEYDWAGPDASTDAAKNYNFMIANNFDPAYAADKAFGASKDDVETMTARFYDSFVKSSFTTPDETKSQQFMKMARDAAVSIANGGAAAPAAPAAGTPDAATPAVPSSSTAAPSEPDYSAIPRPAPLEGKSDAEVIAAVKADSNLSRKSPQMVKKLLEAWGVKPDSIRAAGL